MIRLKQWIIDWLGISHMAQDVYSKLLREHEEREKVMRQTMMTDMINQLMARVESHAHGDDALLDHYAAAALSSGLDAEQALMRAKRVLELKRTKLPSE